MPYARTIRSVGCGTAAGSVHLDELPRRIFRASMIWKATLDANLAAEGLATSVPSGSGLVLFALYEREGWTIGELAQRSKVSHVAVLHVIQRLEGAGLVRRKACPEDGRVTRVWLTPRGRDLEPQMNTLHERNLATLVRVLGVRDAARLGELLERLIEGLSVPVKSVSDAATKSPQAKQSKRKQHTYPL